MTFETEAPRTPTAVKSLELRLTVTEEDDGSNSYRGRYDFHVLDEDGRSLSNRTGDLVPHLTASQITAIKDFLDQMLTKAQGTVA